MKEKILKILIDLNSDFENYDGGNVFDEGLLDSLSVIDLISELCDEFNIQIPAKYVVEDNFKTVDAITTLVEQIINNK